MADEYQVECEYLGGWPHLLAAGEAEVAVRAHDGVVITLKSEHREEDTQERVVIPRKRIIAATYQEERLGFEQAEVEEGILIDPIETLIRHVVVLVVSDPEGIYEHGFLVRFSLPTEYHAKVFEKRCHQAFGLGPF